MKKPLAIFRFFSPTKKKTMNEQNNNETQKPRNTNRPEKKQEKHSPWKIGVLWFDWIF